MISETRLAEPFNGHRARITKIGTVTTAETIEHRIGYETASWYTLVDVPAGTYDVELHEGLGTRWVLVRYTGTVTKEHFVNRVFTASSVHEPTENIGKPRDVTAQIYPYRAAQAFALDPTWELAEDWSIQQHEIEPHDRPGYTAYDLVSPDGGIRI